MGSRKENNKSNRREILAQIKVWKPQECFVYFKVFKLQRWVKRSADGCRWFAFCFPKNRQKNTAAKQPIRLLPAENTLWSLKTAHQSRRPATPIFISAHIPLAGDDLTNNHTFKLLSGLLRQTLYIQNISHSPFSVNSKMAGGDPRHGNISYQQSAT